MGKNLILQNKITPNCTKEKQPSRQANMRAETTNCKECECVFVHTHAQTVWFSPHLYHHFLYVWPSTSADEKGQIGGNQGKEVGDESNESGKRT